MMTNAATRKYVCIHGHFYQPPRENPWLHELEKEESAAPYHDWNERINSECYRANTAARVVDESNRVLNIDNNYKWLSFNFGPTLLTWIEKHDPLTYRSIINADKESCERFHGHGNAIAQAYNHLIMPLAGRRDKITQVLWGIRDFERRFGRSPEGMWLGETAVDRETLEILAEAGIKFTILSPFQADRWRFPDKASGWQDARDGKIPTGRPYLYRCGEGKAIHIFFYDGSLAKEIAFSRLLEHSSRLLNRIGAAFEYRDQSGNDPWLINVATDGESYGHHFKFGDMALTAAFRELEHDPTTQIINYAAFLAAFPVNAEVEIIERTAWSCSHGLGRWESDCGCRTGGEPGWQQKWRAPLREAMDYLRDRLAEHFEREMALLTKDPWEARNEYIKVMLDPENEMLEFRHKFIRPGLSAENEYRFFELLEMQRSAMFMYTSCGWFFADIGGIESVIILRHAARAIQLAAQTGASPLEPGFINILEKAPSNHPAYANGAEVYLKKAKSETVTMERVVANYAIQSLARTSDRNPQIYSYNITPLKEYDLGPNPVPSLLGHVKARDNRTLREDSYTYAVIHFGGLDFRCSVRPGTDPNDDSILKALQESVEGQNTVKMNRILDEVFGPVFFRLHDVFSDLRSNIALKISRKVLSSYTDFQRHFYSIYQPLMISFRQWKMRIPSDLRAAVKRVLSDEAAQLVGDIIAHEQQISSDHGSWRDTDFFYRAHLGRLHSILKDARSWEVELHLGQLSTRLGGILVENLKTLSQNLDTTKLGEIARLLNVCRTLGVKPELWRLQTLYFQFTQNALKDREGIQRIENLNEFLAELDEFLACRFARFFYETS
ncbi:MAG: DUF3536 domain-containing protein [Syntrophobacteraceae bacterium]